MKTLEQVKQDHLNGIFNIGDIDEYCYKNDYWEFILQHKFHENEDYLNEIVKYSWASYCLVENLIENKVITQFKQLSSVSKFLDKTSEDGGRSFSLIQNLLYYKVITQFEQLSSVSKLMDKISEDDGLSYDIMEELLFCKYITKFTQLQPIFTLIFKISENADLSNKLIGHLIEEEIITKIEQLALTPISNLINRVSEHMDFSYSVIYDLIKYKLVNSIGDIPFVLYKGGDVYKYANCFIEYQKFVPLDLHLEILNLPTDENKENYLKKFNMEEFEDGGATKKLGQIQQDHLNGIFNAKDIHSVNRNGNYWKFIIQHKFYKNENYLKEVANDSDASYFLIRNLIENKIINKIEQLSSVSKLIDKIGENEYYSCDIVKKLIQYRLIMDSFEEIPSAFYRENEIYKYVGTFIEYRKFVPLDLHLKILDLPIDKNKEDYLIKFNERKFELVEE